ncbi:MAG TPA: adenylate/guanylate cyclase domain-containing protein [Candidatus Binatia bacterium]|nr:adenylate/guanylate cyclase domain-containing protein [Candidatus Binatia bacterium]
MERKLTAILSADVKGYSRLMGEDEEATIRTLPAYRAVITSLIQQHRGRVVDAPGDNLLAEFASVVDAARCAVEVQQALQAKNSDLPDHRKMEFRIGINLGDVVVEGERLYGDGVNITARLESLAEPGGICISGTVYDQVENKLALRYEYLGEQAVKNIAKPVRVYRLVLKLPSPLAGEGQGEGASGRAGAAKTPHPNPFDEVYPERSRRAQDRLPPQGGKAPKNRRLGTAHRVWCGCSRAGAYCGRALSRSSAAQPPGLSLQD